jgi:hypothetical protein
MGVTLAVFWLDVSSDTVSNAQKRKQANSNTPIKAVEIKGDRTYNILKIVAAIASPHCINRLPCRQLLNNPTVILWRKLVDR